MTNAIRAMMAEQDENNDDSDASEAASDDAPDFAASPLTEGYHVVTEDVDLLRDIALNLAQESGYDVTKPTEVTGDFNPRNYDDEGELDEAATAAMSESVFDEPKAIVGLLGAMEALKARWGGQHTDKVSGEGHHGVGLNTDGTYATARDGSYGDTFPEAPHFEEVVGVEGLNGGERAFLKDELGIPVGDIGVAGNIRLLAPNGDRIPVGFSDEKAEEEGFDSALDHLAAVVDDLSEMPEIPGPEGYDGPTYDASDASSDDRDVAFDPTEFTVKEIRERATDLDSLEVVEEAIEVEKATKDRKGAKERLTQRANALRDDDGDEEAVDEDADADQSDASDDGESVEAKGMSRAQYEASLVANGMGVEEAAEKADERFA